jgi:hypothetical protein
MLTEPSLSSATSGNSSSGAMGSIPAGPIVAPYATIAIRSHIPVVLKLKHPNF